MNRRRTQHPRARYGSTLVELIVALPIAAIIGTVAMALLLDNHRLARRLNTSTEIARELRQASAVLVSEIRPLSAHDVVAWTDTSLDIRALAGSGVVCAIPTANTIDLLPLNGSDALRTSWFATPQAGDEVQTITADSALVPNDERWQSTSLASVTTSGSSTCTTNALMLGGTHVSTNAVRLTLASSLAERPAIGTPVRIARRTRYSLYRSADALWYLGRKTFNGAIWTTVQPVAGPLDRASDHGLRVEVRDSTETPFASGAARTPRSIALTLRGSSAWFKSATAASVRDSVVVHVALRGQMTVAPR
ncbi:MAG: PilW family protein [Gemmatimonas sp.]